ncbi:YtxH domain-containing protein [Bacillus rubiinfantis]|uniref:YtxH domain-containing protein n=1 Tax=Bacillus rubiinfantis TaxID=1499680 RepID=UPI0006941853|nr:YtxH domain-containing protein [Bacillus rubiinfantis]
MTKRDKQEKHQYRYEEGTGSFVLGALVGGVIGAAAALLFAPKTGKELRHTISNNAGSITTKAEQLSDLVKTKTVDLSHELFEQSTSALNKVRGGNDGQQETEKDKEPEVQYISLVHTSESATPKAIKKGKLQDEDIRKKLVETQLAFDEQESRINR